MKSVIFFLLLLTPSLTFGEISPREYCAQGAYELSSMADQFPLQADRQTWIMGGTALFVNGKCHVTYNYLLNQDVFVEIMQESARLAGQIAPSKAQVVLDMNTSYYREKYKNILTRSIPQDLIEIASHDFTVTTLNYSYDKGDIRPIKIVIEDYLP